MFSEMFFTTVPGLATHLPPHPLRDWDVPFFQRRILLPGPVFVTLRLHPVLLPPLGRLPFSTYFTRASPRACPIVTRGPIFLLRREIFREGPFSVSPP